MPPDPPAPAPTAEHIRLMEDAQRQKNWKRWGPYLSERQWGTVREDYSANGDSWNYFPHDHARSRCYRWGEDGLLGFCDRECRLCFSVALWNGNDPILKERLFGLTNPQGNHGEDVKEEYFYIDSTPTHSYCKAMYKYPQAEFPYQQLVDENARRTRKDPEFELADTGVFAQDRYFEVVADFAKNVPDDVLIRITAINRGPEAATIHLIPQLFYRNTWAWGCRHEGCEIKPRMLLSGPDTVTCEHVTLGKFLFHAESMEGSPAKFLFTENETNVARLFDGENYYPNVRDGFHEYLVRGVGSAVNHAHRGTKVGAYYGVELAPGASVSVRLRLRESAASVPKPFDASFDEIFEQRIAEANEFYDSVIPAQLDEQHKSVARQAYAGLLWTKQFYHYIVRDWLTGDPAMPPPPPERWEGRNRDWPHLYSRDVISMPDKWEYPWFATWDLAFHMVAMCGVDSRFVKDQLILLLREWYMHPKGQLPAYEFDFDDVNPPVHAWACWRVYKMTGEKGERDRAFLESAFQKLLINFTWWVNRKDVTGKNVFGGGFLGLDNIGIFDRSLPLPSGHRLEQADGTAWMAFYCGTMLSIALELALDNPAYEDIASKFFEHFIDIVDAINTLGGSGLWDDQDGFYYDRFTTSEGESKRIRLRSMVGLIPLFAVEVLPQKTIDRLPGFKKRLEWFLKYRADLARFISYAEPDSENARRLLAVPSKKKLERMLRYVFDENEFLSPGGIRSLSKFHKKNPSTIVIDGKRLEAHYTPGESDTPLFGGNSNWRGPIWFPLNYLLIESLERYHHFYGEEFTVEYPTGSGQQRALQEVADDLSGRLMTLFRPVQDGLFWFHEYFHGDTGKGLGASHQTGWTALVVKLVENLPGARAGKPDFSVAPTERSVQLSGVTKRGNS